MKRLWIIPLLVIPAIVLLVRWHPQTALRMPPAETPESPPAIPARPQVRLPEPARLPDFEQRTFADRFSSMLAPESLKKYEGSYTIDDLISGRDTAPAVRLDSSWFIGGSNTPTTNIRVRKNPGTGQYEWVGGEVFLPGPGVGVRYEKDGESGETRTFLHIKKSF